MTYKDALGLVKEASKLNWSLKAIKAASNRLHKLRTPIEDPSQYLWFMHSAMKDMPRYRDLPSITLPKELKIPYWTENPRSLPAIARRMERLGIDLEKQHMPYALWKRMMKMNKANQQRQQIVEAFNKMLHKTHPQGFSYSDIPKLLLDPSYNNASAATFTNRIKLGGSDNRDLASLAHEMGHLFSSSRGHKENVPSVIRQLREELQASATGLRALKTMGFDDAYINKARRALKAAYKTYKYENMYDLQKAKQDMFYWGRIHDRQLASPVKTSYPNPRAYRRIVQMEKELRHMPLGKEYDRKVKRLTARQNWISNAWKKRLDSQENYNKAKQTYKQALIDRGLPEEPWLDW